MMPNRHQRRRAAATSTTKLAKLKTATLDQHLDDRMRRIRAEFERTGEIHPGFECVTDRGHFFVPGSWPDRSAKAAACAALRDSFRRRGVIRYVFASEVWMGNTSGLAPTDDPDRAEGAIVIAVERKGSRRLAKAKITRDGQTATLGPWGVDAEPPQSWLLELLEEGHSDRRPKAEGAPVPRLLASDFQNLVLEDRTQEAEFRGSFEIHEQLRVLMAGQMQNDDNGDPLAAFMALESALRSVVRDMGSPKGIGEFARFLRDHPDLFPMFSTVPDSAPSTEHFRCCKATLLRFICEKRGAGHTDSAIYAAFMNMYMYCGSQAIGALSLADRIDAWDPKHQAKLRQVGLRSSYELDDEEGRVFLALSADRYPIGVRGRLNAVGDVFVSEVIACPEDDYATTIANIRQHGIALILGSEAEELLRKLEQVRGVAG
jgi:hypothetical protein